MALRVRRSGDTFTQTLKDGGDGAFSRGEWETRLEGPNPDVGVLKHTPAARILAKAGRLAPVYVVDVRRRVADVARATARSRSPSTRASPGPAARRRPSPSWSWS